MKQKKIIVLILALFLSFVPVSCLKSTPASPEPLEMGRFEKEARIAQEETILSEIEAIVNPMSIDHSQITAEGSRKLCEFGIRMTNDGMQPVIPQEWLRIFQQYEGYFVGSAEEKKVYLTFDLGYEAGYTEALLDKLKELDIPASFFLVTHYLQTRPDLVERMVNEGHVVGNHSTVHKSLPGMSKEEIIHDTHKAQALFHELSGKVMHYYRPPMGHFCEYSMDVIYQMGYKSIFWSIAYPDWEPSSEGWEKAHRIVTTYIHPGAVVLMHLVSPENLEALPHIVATLREQGYAFAQITDF
jgi:peptidoglycan-N-acetylmuramic acid deacetylase